MYAEVKEAGGLSAQQVCDWVGYQMYLSPSSKPKPKSVRRGALQEQWTYPSAPVDTPGVCCCVKVLHGHIGAAGCPCP